MTARQNKRIRKRLNSIPPGPFDPGRRNIGWVDRDGYLYKCSYMEHLLTARKICRTAGIMSRRDNDLRRIVDAEQKLEKLGWLKITGIGPIYAGTYHATVAGGADGRFPKPTRVQYDFGLEFLMDRIKNRQGSEFQQDIDIWIEMWDGNTEENP